MIPAVLEVRKVSGPLRKTKSRSKHSPKVLIREEKTWLNSKQILKLLRNHR